MALSRGTLNNPDLLDVAVNLVAFETINRCKISIWLSVIGEGGKAEVSISAVARDIGSVNPDQNALASVSAICSAMNLRTLDAALIHLLYMLDGKLAEQEFADVKKREL